MCRISRVEEICEIKQIRKLDLLKDYPHTHASVGALRMLGLRQEIKQIDDILKNLKLSGCHNNQIYKEKIEH
jgi:endonuclease IV